MHTLLRQIAYAVLRTALDARALRLPGAVLTPVARVPVQKR